MGALMTLPDWLLDHRAAAQTRFDELGLPTHRDEAWKFSDLRGFDAARPFAGQDHAIDHASVARHLLAGPAHRLVLVNGIVQPQLSDVGKLPAGVWLASLAETIARRPDLARHAFPSQDVRGGQAFAALNATRCRDGFVLALEPGVRLERPVEILHVNDATAAESFHARSLVQLGAGAQAELVESCVGRGGAWNNQVCKLDVADGATLRHVRLQAESPMAIHFASTFATLGAAAALESFVVITGGRLSRHDLHVTMQGEAARMVLNAAYLLRGEQETVLAPTVDHQAAAGETHELVKGVLEDHAHGVFLGTIMVRPGADGTDARQLNRNLMTSAQARVDTRPELTIYADDVKCSHGATVGELDEAALFYLLSRGIAPAQARHMLIEAFAAEIFDAAALAPATDALLRGHLEKWLVESGRTA